MLLILVFLTSLTLIPQNTVKAQNKTIVVPEDYRTIQEAVDNARDGDTIFVKNGIYNETLLIEKGISLIGENANYTILNGPSVNNITLQFSWAIEVTANSVKISGFTISNGAGSGIWVQTSSDGTEIIGNTFKYCLTAVSLFGSHATVDKNIFFAVTGILCRGNFCNITSNNIWFSPGYGIDIEGDNNLVSSNNITDPYREGQGIFINGNSNTVNENMITEKSDGIIVFIGLHNTVSANTITNCADSGVSVDQGSNNTFVENTINHCKYGAAIGGVYLGVYNNTLYGNNFINNTNQVAVYGSNYWNNGKIGNYWSDYDGNGSYIIDENNIDHYPLTQQVDINSIAPTPTSVITSDFNSSMPVAISLIVVIVLVIGLLFYRKHSKNS
jgi:parallel beta-helix repeat protein